MEKITRKKLSEQVHEYVKQKINKNFEFREYQEDIIIDILSNILAQQKNIHDELIYDVEGIDKKNPPKTCHTIEAPTGSGKSLINIISAGVLSDYYTIRSFILASDLTLWEQYNDFIDKHPKLGFGKLKGLDNYKCNKNGHGLYEAECKLAGHGFNELFNGEVANKHGFSCAKTCKYIKDRKKALKANVTLLTYHLYLYCVGPNYMDTRGPVFDTRDVVFCDECHNIPNIMQLRYQFVIKRIHQNYLYFFYDQIKHIENRTGIFENGGQLGAIEMEVDDCIKEVKSKFPTLNSLKAKYTEAYDKLINYRTTNEEDYDLIYDILEFWCLLDPIKECCKERIHDKVLAHMKLTKEDKDVLYNEKKFQMYVSNSAIKMFLNIISDVGVEYLVKSLVEIENDDRVCQIQCAKEDYLTWFGLLRITPIQVMLSATVGNWDNFEDNIGIKYLPEENQDIKKDIIPSTFDFSKSPIYFLNKYKMSMNDREESLKKLKPIIYKLLDEQFKDSKGMIQTGSYAIAKEIIADAPQNIKSRFLYYNGNNEKNAQLALHQMMPNTILIGPTLCQGIDLPGDLCRFIFILKMPYPMIKDRLVTAKINLFPFWYNSTTSNEIIQGIGRGNRFKDDWCITYIMDACFLKLYTDTQEQYPDFVQDRIKII